jgi:ABC-type spermidine/putrescine transport system permease subunit II
MQYLETLPRRWVTLYIPLLCFLVVLLFPFYWMTMTSFKPDAELISRDANPFWIVHPTFAHFEKLLFHTSYPEWMWNTIIVSVVATITSLVASVLAAYAIERLRFRGAKGVGMAIFLAYLVPPSILFIPLAAIVFQLGLFDTRWALILTVSDVPHPVLHVAPDGLLSLDPVRARGVRADRRRYALADPHQDHPAARGSRADLGRDLRVYAVVERIHLCAHVHLVL